MKWYDVTFRGTAEMTVSVLAESPEDARERAEDGNYEDSENGSPIEFLKTSGYAVKVRRSKPKASSGTGP